MAATRPRATTRERPGSTARSWADGVREFGGRLGMRQGVGAGLGDDQDVFDWKQVWTRLPENLANETLQAVADDRVADPAADGDAEAGGRARGGCGDHYQVVGMPATALTLH